MFAGFVARMEDTRLPKSAMFGELVGGAGCVGGQEKEWMGCLLDDLRVFGISADEWTTAAQDEGGWHKTVEQGVERFNGEVRKMLVRLRENGSTGWARVLFCPHTVCVRIPHRHNERNMGLREAKH